MSPFRFSRILLASLVLSGGFIAAEDPPAIEGDGREELKVAVAAFSGTNLSPLQESLSVSFPRRLREALSGVDRRLLSLEELAAYRRWAREKALLAEGKTAQDARNAAGKTVFSPSPNPASLESLLKNEKMAAERIEALSELPDEDIASSMERKIAWQGGAGEELLPAVDGDPLVAAARQDLDILLYGHLIGFEEYLAVDIVLYGRFTGKPLLSWKTAFAQDDSVAALDEVIQALTNALAGRPMGAIKLDLEPRNADFWLDGNYAGRGDSLLSGLDPGPHTIEVRAEGHRGRVLGLEILPSTEQELSVILEPEAAPNMAVLGPEDGIPVYVDATRVGLTPLELASGDSTHVIRARSGDAEDLKVTSLGAGESVFLDPTIAEKGEGFTAKRDDFYLSFGWFMLSLPLAVLCNGIYDVQYRATLASPGIGWETLRWSTFAVSGGLLGVSIWKFVEYLASTERK